MTQAVWLVSQLGAWGAILLAAGGTGAWLARRVRFAGAAERAAFSIALGLGAWALALFLLALAGLLYREAVLALTAIAAGLTVMELGGAMSAAARKWLSKLRHRPFLAAVLALALLYWGAFVYTTLYPPIAWDTVSHHFVLARNALASHAVSADKGLPYPVLLALNHMLFAWGMSVGGDTTALLVCHGFLALTALGLFAWGERSGDPWLGAAAAEFWIAQPILVWLSQAGYVDLGIAAFLFFGIYALRVFADGGEREWWYLAVALLAFASGVKLPGLLALAIAGAFGLWRLARRPPGFTARELFGGALLGLLVAAPWYGWIAFHTGDPFWPTLPELARREWAPDAVYAAFRGGLYSSAGAPKGLVDFLRIPWDWVYHSDKFQAEDGRGLHPLLIAWPVAWLVALRDRSVRWWTACALAWILFWFFAMPHVLRYVVPALPFVTLALFESVSWILSAVRDRVPRAVRSFVFAAAGATFLVWPLPIVRDRARHFGRPPASRAAREAFLASHVEAYGGARFINEHASASDRTWLVNASWLNYRLQGPVIDAISMLERDNWPVFHWPRDERWQSYVESRGVAWILVGRSPAAYLPPPALPESGTFWPDYRLAYEDPTVWVFHREPGRPAVR